jgi:GNAT superfamily N-acetyltransferase
VNSSKTGTEIELRPWRDDDEPRVLELLQAALGAGPAGVRPSEFFRWKHVENPFGRSFMLIAEAGGRLVGLRAFMRWRFRVDGRIVQAVRAVDTATHPDYQGRGVFSMLTLRAIEEIRDEVELIFNTPNEKSLPGYLKMGWETVGHVPILIWPRHPVRLLRERHSLGTSIEPTGGRPPIAAETAAAAMEDEDEIAHLLDRTTIPEPRFSTDRSLAYLKWRYASPPLLDYRAIRETGSDGLRGLAVFRVRPRGRLWESTLAEVIVGVGDRTTARRLLQRVRHAASVDHISASFPRGSTQAHSALRRGFLRVPGGLIMVVNPLREHIRPEPRSLSSWAVSLGDLEVF